MFRDDFLTPKESFVCTVIGSLVEIIAMIIAGGCIMASVLLPVGVKVFVILILVCKVCDAVRAITREYKHLQHIKRLNEIREHLQKREDEIMKYYGTPKSDDDVVNEE